MNVEQKELINDKTSMPECINIDVIFHYKEINRPVMQTGRLLFNNYSKCETAKAVSLPI
jgi:hypothetical protein